MPLPKNMDKCMSKVKDEFPKGRSDKKKNKKEAHKQHVAMCLSVKEAKNMTFKDYLIERETTSITDAVEMLKSRKAKITYDAVGKILGTSGQAVKVAVDLYPTARLAKQFNAVH